jgi:hypothetical protein
MSWNVSRIVAKAKGRQKDDVENECEKNKIVEHIDEEEDGKTIEKSVNSPCLWASFHPLTPFSDVSEET